ncbi:MAG: hypothetical protein ACREXR_23235, partial [Gammaproteobacteria bacterium]
TYTVRDVLKKWKLGALSLISITIAAASFVSAAPAGAEPAAQGITEEQGVRATLTVRLQSIRLALHRPEAHRGRDA